MAAAGSRRRHGGRWHRGEGARAAGCHRGRERGHVGGGARARACAPPPNKKTTRGQPLPQRPPTAGTRGRQAGADACTRAASAPLGRVRPAAGRASGSCARPQALLTHGCRSPAGDTRPRALLIRGCCSATGARSPTGVARTQVPLAQGCTLTHGCHPPTGPPPGPTPAPPVGGPAAAAPSPRARAELCTLRGTGEQAASGARAGLVMAAPTPRRTGGDGGGHARHPPPQNPPDGTQTRSERPRRPRL